MGRLNANPLLLEEPIRLASILEHSHLPRSLVCLTKLIGTVGGNSKSPEVLAALLHAGMTAARFDFSYGNLDSHLETLKNLQEAMRKTNKLCAVICDTSGPEVIIPNKTGEAVELKEGSTVTLRSSTVSFEELGPDAASASPTLMHLSIPGLAQAVSVGGEIFVGQYLFTGSESTSVWLKIIETNGEDIVCEAKNSATLRGSFFTVHVSQVHIPLPTLPEKDKSMLALWLEKGGFCDILSLSFTRHADDIKEAREMLKSYGSEQTQVFAKIENMEGLSNFDGILEAVDGVILGRGDLGIDLPPQKVFLFQKEAIQRCNFAGKPVIISRVVDTMTDTPRPTRAEATDVANAVLDGVDAIMLGAETLRGLYPIETVTTVGRICGEAEKVHNQPNYYKQVTDSLPDRLTELESISASAVTAAEQVHASCIVIFTTLGKTARLVAKYKPTMPAITLVVPSLKSNQLSWTFSGEVQARQALVVRGLIPMLAGSQSIVGEHIIGATNESMLKAAIEKGKSLGILRTRDRVVVVQKMKNSWVVKVVDA